MRTNKKATVVLPRTHEGAVAARLNNSQKLRRLVLASMLWEDQFYIDGVSHADYVKQALLEASPEEAASIAIEAREKMKLRHVPLFLVRELARHPVKEARKLVGDTLARIVQRPDELAEFLGIYWAEGKQPLSAQVKKGLARAFSKFNEYELAKWQKSDAAIKLRDVLFLTHARPENGQEELFKKIVDQSLATPDTWEVALSAGSDKKETWVRLLSENKLGALALLRNLRNMQQVGVSDALIKDGLQKMKIERVLPFRFISAAKYAPGLEPQLEEAMFKCLAEQPKLKGKTVLIVDTSGSMHGQISAKSELDRLSAAAALAMLVRELGEDVKVYATAGDDGTRIHKTMIVPPRRGFGLRDLLSYDQTSRIIGGGGIFLKQVIEYVREKEQGEADRIIVITDEQDCDLVNRPTSAKPFGTNNYLINVATYKNGIGYGEWVHIDGWSESVLDYIQASEKQAGAQ
jgi:60 kDa SS-A/Ro ribonucleoprotein